MPLPVALQLYTVRENMAADLKGTLARVRKIGYDGVEFAGLFDVEATAIRAMLDEYGLKAVSAHVPLDAMLADPDKVMADYQTLGCPYIAIPWLPEALRPGKGDFQKTLKDIRFLCEKAKEHGLIMLYHNHDFEFELVDGQPALDLLYREIPESLLQTELDTCWIGVAGYEPAVYLHKYAGRAPVVHLKDYSMRGKEKPQKLYELIGVQEDKPADTEETFGFRPLGYGVQDIPALLAAAKDAKAAWVVVEQDRPAPGQDEWQSAELSRETLRKLGW